MQVIRLIWESFKFALGALKSNLLRTTLSLLGVTVGIFAIIAVFTLVDSVEIDIRKNMSYFGDKVIYVQKWPWIFQKNFAWYKYVNRPQSSLKEYKLLEKTLTYNTAIAMYARKDSRTLSYNSNSVRDVNLRGVTYDFKEVSEVKIKQGRYFLPSEIESGKLYIIIGSDIAETLFPFVSPIGKKISMKGLRYQVIGVMEKQGKSLIGLPSNDGTALVSLYHFMTLFNIKIPGTEPVIAIKGILEDKNLLWLENEVRGKMRSFRGLKPFQEDNFAINRPEMISSTITSIFDVISLAGAIIGSFSILVGGFGIANIMFVSVRERTNIIGIQKALGAKNYFILFQFLFEAVLLSIIGGVAGLLMVYGLTAIPQDSLTIILTSSNVALGITISVLIGVVSGIVPAISASRMDPVTAIRNK